MKLNVDFLSLPVGGFLLIELSSPAVGYLTTAFTCLP